VVIPRALGGGRRARSWSLVARCAGHRTETQIAFVRPGSSAGDALYVARIRRLAARAKWRAARCDAYSLAGLVP
jgi:hypothetical protein